jgi:hypothetical protein
MLLMPTTSRKARVRALETWHNLGGSIEAFELWLRTVSTADLERFLAGAPLPARFAPLKQSNVQAPDRPR